jgi:hypothetical protein
MRIGKAIKRIVALTAGTTLLGTTLMGAMAADLADYPSQYIDDGVFDGLIVVGEKAATGDVIGAVDIAAQLQADAVSEVPISGSGVAVSGGKVEEVALNTDLTTDFGASGLDDNDIGGLQDDEMTIDIDGVDNDYDFHDEITVTSGISVETGLTATNADEDFEDKIFLEVAKDSVKYNFVFDDSLVDGNYIMNATSDYPITIDFMDRELKITGATATSMTVEVGTEQYLDAGDSVTVDGQEFTLVKCSDTAAVIESEGQIETISLNSDKSFGSMKVEVIEIFNDDGTEWDSATLLIGDYTTKTYTDGDEYIGEDENDPDWVWDLANLGTSSPTIGITYDQTLDDSDEVVYMGEDFELPNGFATISIVGINQDEYQDYVVSDTIEDLQDSEGDEIISARVLHFESLGGTDDGFVVNDTIETDDIYVYTDTGDDRTWIFYKDDSDNKIKEVLEIEDEDEDVFEIDYRDTSLGVDLDTNGTFFNWTIAASNQDIVLYTEISDDDEFTYIGHSDGATTTAEDIVVDGTDISGWDEDTKTQDGIIITAYEDTDSSDEFRFSVPEEEDDYKVNVVIKSKEGAVTSSGTTADKVNPIPVGMGVLDKDATVGAENLIVVGGPCANTIAAELLGNPDPCGEGFEQGKAMIKAFDSDDKVSILVAGYEAMESQGACRVLANYEDYDLEGDEMEVTVTSLSNLEVASAE